MVRIHSPRPTSIKPLAIPAHAQRRSSTISMRNVLTADPEWSISAIVLWEITKLHQLGRLIYGLDHATFTAAVNRLQVWPNTRQVCLKLDALDFRSDPAHDIIAATSLAHDIPLLTRDSRLRESKIVKLA